MGDVAKTRRRHRTAESMEGPSPLTFVNRYESFVNLHGVMSISLYTASTPADFHAPCFQNTKHHQDLTHIQRDEISKSEENSLNGMNVK